MTTSTTDTADLGAATIVPIDEVDLPSLPDPVLAYGDTSGHSGSRGSREAVEQQDASGRSSYWEQAALTLLTQNGEWGLTGNEFITATGGKHQNTSRALSNLHKAGIICLLTKQREGTRSCIYALPEHVGERKTQPPRSVVTAAAKRKEMRDLFDALLAEIDARSTPRTAQGCEDAKQAVIEIAERDYGVEGLGRL